MRYQKGCRLGRLARSLEALRYDRTIQEIVAKHSLLPMQISTRKKQVVDGMAEVFANGGSSDEGR